MKKMMQWKSLDAYNYFKSGHVREVKIKIICTSTTILIAKVNPNQNSSVNTHHAWIAFKKDGDVITGHCTKKVKILHN